MQWSGSLHAKTEKGTISFGKLKSSVQFMALGNAPKFGFWSHSGHVFESSFQTHSTMFLVATT